MMELGFSDRFFNDIESVESAAKQDEILHAIELLPTIPEMGSRRFPDSILEEFGQSVRKLVVSPFLVVCEIVEDEDMIFIHGLMHQRQAR